MEYTANQVNRTFGLPIIASFVLFVQRNQSPLYARISRKSRCACRKGKDDHLAFIGANGSRQKIKNHK
jgi:hypothetical protein